MNLKRIDHVALDVDDREAAVAFYEGVLGMQAGPTPTAQGDPVFVGDDRARVALFSDHRPIRHFALETDREGLEELRRRLTEHGVAFRPERHQHSDSIYFSDPSGNRIEVTVPR